MWFYVFWTASPPEMFDISIPSSEILKTLPFLISSDIRVTLRVVSPLSTHLCHYSPVCFWDVASLYVMHLSQFYGAPDYFSCNRNWPIVCIPGCTVSSVCFTGQCSETLISICVGSRTPLIKNKPSLPFASCQMSSYPSNDDIYWYSSLNTGNRMLLSSMPSWDMFRFIFCHRHGPCVCSAASCC